MVVEDVSLLYAKTAEKQQVKVGGGILSIYYSSKEDTQVGHYGKHVLILNYRE